MTKLYKLLIASTLLFLTACTSVGLVLVNMTASIKGGYTLQEASYGPDQLHKMDIYVPSENLAIKKEVVFFIHGGRWQSGKKEDYRFVGAAFAQRGFITVIPNFRKYPQVRFPVFVQDTAKALAWVDDHIAAYGGQPRRIHLVGHSSGAHMAALLTVDERYLATENKDAHVLIKDFTGLAGPYAFIPNEKDLMDAFGPPERYPQMQVTTFIDGKEPPMLLLYGQKDNVVKRYNLERLAQSIHSKNGRVKVITYPTLDHIGVISTFSDLGPKSGVVDCVIKFFKTNNHD
jgi:acetyl esterase/lipase